MADRSQDLGREVTRQRNQKESWRHCLE
jgi:hypothetical protein